MAPTALCYHAKITTQGCCGLCAVAIKEAGFWHLRLACQMKTKTGLIVKTVNAQVLTARASVAKLLLRHAPFNNLQCEELLVKALLRKDSENLTRSEISNVISATIGDETLLPAGCILCGLCVGICKNLGHNRLVMLGRGSHTRIAYIPAETGHSCASCRVCQHICPTGYISDTPDKVFPLGLYR